MLVNVECYSGILKTHQKMFFPIVPISAASMIFNLTSKDSRLRFVGFIVDPDEEVEAISKKLLVIDICSVVVVQ